MAFTFQTHSDLKFKQDDYLLNKAEQYKPDFIYHTYFPTGICELIQDESKLEGWTMKSTNRVLEKESFQKEDTIIFDFGQHHVGYFSINMDSIGSPMDAPLYLRLRFAEVPAELTHESEEYDGWLARGWIQEEFIHLDTLPCTLKLPRRYSFRYAEIKIIDTSPKWQVVFSNPKVVTERCVDNNQLQKMTLEDPKLQAIYDVGVKTLHDCMSDVFEDGPKRDRRLWLGDLRLQALANYYTYDKQDLVKRCLYLFAGMTTIEGKISANVFVKPKNVPDDTFLFDYSIFFISTLYDYLQYHQDQELLDDLYETAKKQMAITLRYVKNGEYMPDENYPVFVDWSNEFNKDTCGQAIIIYGLKQFIELTKMMHQETSYYEQVLNQMMEYSKNVLYNASKKLFKTTHDEYNLASQVWMVLAGVLSKEESQAVMKESIKQFFPVRHIATPYMYHHITEALFQVDLREEGITLMKDYWGKMIDLGADTYWEAFMPENPHYSPYGNPIISSYCHAWSCTPVYLIQKYLK